MNTKLKQYFPVICTREEVLHEIEKDMKLMEQFYSWKEEQRQEVLDFCTGVKGIKLFYDGFFKAIMACIPEYGRSGCDHPVDHRISGIQSHVSAGI